MSKVSNFIFQYINELKKIQVDYSDLYKSYCKYCINNSVDILSQKEFSKCVYNEPNIMRIKKDRHVKVEIDLPINAEEINKKKIIKSVLKRKLNIYQSMPLVNQYLKYDIEDIEKIIVNDFN